MFPVTCVQVSVAVCRTEVEKRIPKIFLSDWYGTPFMGVLVFQVPKARALDFLMFSCTPNAAT
jgi:hypothetical protein